MLIKTLTPTLSHKWERELTSLARLRERVARSAG
jgi:hypothetical protein